MLGHYVRDRARTGPELHRCCVFSWYSLEGCGRGLRALSLLLDPAQDPSGENVSIFKRLFPDRHTLILSGDTGNGFRSYDMLWSYLAPQHCPVILLETAAQLAGTCLG